MLENPLGDLPDELLLDVVEYLDTARDVAHFAASNRRVQNLIRQNGWKTFVKARFPSLVVPTSERTEWSDVARRLTYQDMCWEKRGFWMSVVQEKKAQGRYQRRPVGGQSVSFQAVLDARVNRAVDCEVLAAGVGENLIVRMRTEGAKEADVWHQVQGKSHGYSAGTGDVTAVSIIGRSDVTEVVVGRANGDVQILSAGDDFAESRQNLRPVDDIEVDRVSDPMRKSPGQLAVSWTEWQPQSNLLASCKGSVMTLYDLTNEADTDLTPVAYHDFSKTGANDEASLVRGAKFLSKDVMACALGGSREPIQWSQITPYGIEFMKTAKNERLRGDMRSLGMAQFGEKITVRAIEPVRGGGENLLLSAWDDGTYRLFDIRTPSPQDAIYRDRFQPYEAGSSLLVYGTERFVAGSNTAPDLRLFDFRYPKPYHYTSALPCSPQAPFPIPKDAQRAWSPSWKTGEQRTHCNHTLNQPCPWHDLSTRDYWRPDATVHVGHSMYDRIYCLSKASDISNTIYCGLRGAFMEMNMQLTTDIDRAQASPTLPPGWSTGRPGGRVSLIETGSSLCQSSGWSTEIQSVPELIVQEPRRKSVSQEQVVRHRLDYAFSKPQDWVR